MAIRHIARQGDCLASIAAEHGIHDVHEVRGHADNEALREQRPTPTVLAPGDVVAVPERTPRTFSCREGGQHRFVAQLPRTRLRIRLVQHGEALAGEPFVVEVGGRRIEGTTDGDGLLDVPVPALEHVALVALERAGEAFAVGLGQLDPLDSDSGIAQRLGSLGFGPAAPGSESLAGAIARFRQAHGLDAGGGADDDFTRALGDAYGS